jgi:hypothetical protein
LVLLDTIWTGQNLAALFSDGGRQFWSVASFDLDRKLTLIGTLPAGIPEPRPLLLMLPALILYLLVIAGAGKTRKN